MKKKFKAIVRGRVQGVYFRASTRDVAQDLDLGGYVRNLPDGSVEVVAGGEPESIDRLLSFLRRGPDHAEVESVDVDWDPSADAPRPFGIRS